MRLVEFTLVRGHSIYINPESICSICDDDCNKDMAIIKMTTSQVHVRGTAKEAYDKLIKEAKFDYISMTSEFS